MELNETGLVFDAKGQTLYWHRPLDRSNRCLPDSRELWDVLWENRKQLGGVAHTHPWVGAALPSQTDLSTWRAIEKGLGRLLLWPVVTFSEVRCYGWNPWAKEYEDVTKHVELTFDVGMLRKLSGQFSEVEKLVLIAQDGGDIGNALLKSMTIPQGPLQDGTVCTKCGKDALEMVQHLVGMPGAIVCTSCGHKEGYYAHIGRNIVTVTPLRSSDPDTE